MTEVVVVGAGPVGLFLACELRLAGVDVTVLEQRAERGDITKGVAMHARTLELLAMRGLAETFLDNGVRLPGWHFGFLEQRVDFTGLDSPYPFVLSFPQDRTEAILEDRALALGARIVRGVQAVGLRQDHDSVRVQSADAEYRAAYVIGADGAASTVRKLSGIDFPGTDATFYSYLGDVVADSPPAPGFNVVNENGAMMVAPMPGGFHRVAGYDPLRQHAGRGALSLDELRETASRISGADFGLHSPKWMTQFDSATRVASSYRAGRVLLAGDAAHMHFPAGGVGLNLGLQDAMNLGWKLAAVVRGRAPATFLDTYETERKPWAEDVARHTMAQTALITATTAEGLALRQLLSDLMGSLPEMSQKIARRLSAIDVHYPPADPDAHPLTGTRVPVAAMPDGRPTTLEISPGTTAIVRPDGYVWWAGKPEDAAAFVNSTGEYR
ncbi:FAD-dependent monooxygenase [Actinoplanes sp. CA-142083]|uniref:FAD-dependent monooxygenase n=1 Tax=Actinoplanes sp. CA-142083 TaxID=3239903 RepID=UPI003D8F2515